MRDGPIMLTEGLEVFRVTAATGDTGEPLRFALDDPYTLIFGSEHVNLSHHWTDNGLVQMSQRDLRVAADVIEELMDRF